VQLQQQQPTKVFKLDEFGAPPYPELVAFTRNQTIQSNPALVAFTRNQTIQSNPALVCAFVKATVDGYKSATANPDAALQNLADQAEGLSLSDAKPQYEALAPIYKADAPVYGKIDLKVLSDYLTWAKQAKILDLSDDPSKFATDKFLPSA